MIFWLFLIIITLHAAQYSGSPKIAVQARAINNFFGHSKAAFMSGPVIILATFWYFYFGRKKLSWYNGVLIDDKPIHVTHYQIKRTITNVLFIYLKTANWLYIVYPTTSQDGRKLPDVKIMAKEMALNEQQVAILKRKLEQSGAIEKSFWFFTNDVVISFLIFLIIAIIVLV